MWLMQRLLETSIFVLVLQQIKAESRIYNGGYGFGAPINVGGESAYGLGSSLGSTSSSANFGLSSGLSGLNGLNGLYHGYGSSSGAGLGYGLTASSYPGLHNFNNFQQNPFAQSAGSLYPSSNFGGSFYPGSGGYFGQNFGGYGLQRPFHIGSGGGIGNFGQQPLSGFGNGLSNGYPLSNGYQGLGGQFGGLSGYGASPFGSSFGFGGQQHFK